MTIALGTFSQLGIHTADPVTARFDFLKGAIGKSENIVDANGIRGVRSRVVDRTRPGTYRIGGSISMEPNNAELVLLLPWILGGSPSGTAYPLADALSSRYITVDKILKVPTYAGCFVDTATFRASTGSPLSVDLTIVGQTETLGNAGTFPSLSINSATTPWVFSDCVIVVGGVTVYPTEFTLTINNMITKDRFFNSLSLIAPVAQDREIEFSTNISYGDSSTLYDSGNAGVTVTITLTNGTSILTFSLVKVVFPAKSPMVTGRSELFLPVEGMAYKSGSTMELVTTLAP